MTPATVYVLVMLVIALAETLSLSLVMLVIALADILSLRRR
jgi:hypothetical protein